jgi:release factor glutamine methyltransferase
MPEVKNIDILKSYNRKQESKQNMSKEDNNWTVKKVLQWTTGRFQEAGISTPRLDAELLISDVIGQDRVGVYMDLLRPLTPQERDKLRTHVSRRIKREPIAYILGEKAFYGITLSVDKGVLIPRPDSESLVELALGLLKPSMSVVDIGTGSGALILAIGDEMQGLTLYGTDISPQALQVAKNNGEALNIDVSWYEGDLLSPVEDLLFDMVISNPPYIPNNCKLEPEIGYEPSGALFSGASGLDIIRRLCKDAITVLKPGGWLLFEFGDGQEDDVKGILESFGWREIFIKNDLASNPRVACGRLKKDD